MNYLILLLIFLFAILVDCAKPVSLREAPKKIEDDQKSRSLGDYPENAKSGHCYTKASVPAEYRTVFEKVLVSEATSRVEQIPAIMEMVEEKVIDKPGSSFWKKSVQGDLYCYEEIPPVYKTVKKEVMKSPATSKFVDKPAEYKTVEKQELVKPERNEWTEVLCGNNAKPPIIEKIQKSLKDKGYSPGRTDGQLDEETMNAISKYQKDKKLKPSKDGLINMETVESLGVNL